MKTFKITLIAMFFALVIALVSGCGGGTSGAGSQGLGPNTPVEVPISIEGLDGEIDIATDATFKYALDGSVDASEITEGSFFIVKTSFASANMASPLKAVIDLGICDINNRLDADVSCDSEDCVLDPDADLACNTNYTICLIPKSFMSSFTTTACSVELSVSSITDGSGGALVNDATDVWPSSFNIAFDAAIDYVDLANALSITCGAYTLITSVDDAGVANTYTVTVTDAYKYQLMDCTLTIENNFASKSGTASLADNVTYDFTNACSVTDDFLTDSLECWLLSSQSIGYDDSMLTISGDDSMVCDTTVGTVGSSAFTYQKEVTASSSGFDLIVRIWSGSALPGQKDVLGSKDNFFLVLATGIKFEESVYVGLDSSELQNPLCQVEVVTNEGTATATAACSDDSNDYCIKFSIDNDDVSLQYSSSTGCENYSDMNLVDDNNILDNPAVILDKFAGNDIYLIFTAQDSAADNYVIVDRLETSGITSRGADASQY